MNHNTTTPETVTQRIKHIQRQQEIDAEVHALWGAPETRTDVDGIVNALNTLNHSVDRRLEKIVDVLLLLTRSLERR